MVFFVPLKGMHNHKPLLMRLLIFVLILLPFSIQSQNKIWAEDGARWMYELSTFVGPNIYEVEQSGTKVINGKTCQEFTTTLFRFYHGPNYGDAIYTGSNTEATHYTYVSGDTVYLLVDNQFRVLYNFSALPGDQWDLGYDTSQTGCDPAITMVVDTGDTIMGGQKLRYIELEMLSLNSVATVRGRVYEKIGSFGYLFPEKTGGCNFIPEDPMAFLKCYKDDFFPEMLLTQQRYDPIWAGDCEANFWVGIDEHRTTQTIEIYPNPFSQNLLINVGNEAADVKIFDLSGRIVWEGAGLIGTIEINTLSWSTGFYSAKTVRSDAIEFRKLIRTEIQY